MSDATSFYSVTRIQLPFSFLHPNYVILSHVFCTTVYINNVAVTDLGSVMKFVFFFCFST